MNRIFVCLTLVAAVLLSACQKPALTRPEGFADYENREQGYKAISPDRIMYRVRTHDNEENGDLAFWKIALKTHMRDSGYIVVSESDTAARTVPGYLLALAAPVGTKDYSYLVALFLHKGKLVVIESAGEVSYFETRRSDIIQTIQNTDISAATN